MTEVQGVLALKTAVLQMLRELKIALNSFRLFFLLKNLLNLLLALCDVSESGYPHYGQ